MSLDLFLKLGRMSLVTGVLLTIWMVYSVPKVLEAHGDNQAANNVFLWVASASFAVDIYRNVQRMKASKSSETSHG